MEGQLPEKVQEEIRKAYFESDFTPMYHIYADLEALQDFRLGALLNMITTEPEYDYIIHQLPKYIGRFDDHTMKYFPVIEDITDKDITKFIKDSNNHSLLTRISPMTSAFDLLPEFITQMHMCNHRCSEEKKRINLTIGTSSVIYTQSEKQNLIKLLTSMDGFLDVTIINRPFTKLEEETMFSFNVYLWYDIANYMRHPKVLQAMGEDNVFFNKKVFALPILENTPMEGQTVEDLLVNTKVVLDVCCDFEYVERGLQETPQ